MIELPAGEIVRVRILNVDNTVTYRLNLPGAEAKIYAIDGHPVEPRDFGKGPNDQYWIGPGMRLELGIRGPAEGAELSLRNGPVRLATIRGVANPKAPTAKWPAALPHNPVSEPDLKNAETINFKFEWVGAISDYSKGQSAPSLWQINGVAWQGGEEHKHNAPPLAKLKDHPMQAAIFGDMPEAEFAVLLDHMSRRVQKTPVETLACGLVVPGLQRVRAARELGWDENEIIVHSDMAAMEFTPPAPKTAG